MRSYTSLAVLALAVSTASPACSAPVQESQQQARSPLDDGILGFLNKNDNNQFVGSHKQLIPLPLVQRAGLGGIFSSSIGKNLFNGVLGGLASTIAGFGANELLNNKRRAWPHSLEDCFEENSEANKAACVAGFVARPVEARDSSARDLIDALRFLRRQLDELD